MITTTDVHNFFEKLARVINFDPNKGAKDNTDLARQKENEAALAKCKETGASVCRVKGGENEDGTRSPTITGAAASSPEKAKATMDKAMGRGIK